MTLTFDCVTRNPSGSSTYPQIMCEVWKWSSKYHSQYCAHKVLQSANLTLTFDRTTQNQYIIFIYIYRAFPLIIPNLCHGEVWKW